MRLETDLGGTIDKVEAKSSHSQFVSMPDNVEDVVDGCWQP